mgnify:CR=1 FL=1
MSRYQFLSITLAFCLVALVGGCQVVGPVADPNYMTTNGDVSIENLTPWNLDRITINGGDAMVTVRNTGSMFGTRQRLGKLNPLTDANSTNTYTLAYGPSNFDSYGDFTAEVSIKAFDPANGQYVGNFDVRISGRRYETPVVRVRPEDIRLSEYGEQLREEIDHARDQARNRRQQE